MTTREVVLEYLERVKAKHGWEDFLDEDFQFTNYGHPVARANGQQALERIRRFYGMVNTMEIRSLIVEGVHACALMWYEIRSPDGAAFESHIAEVFEVSGGKIGSFGIYFDSALYPKPPNTAK